MAKNVRLKSGTHYDENNERRDPGDEFVVSDLVYETFAFKFELLDELGANVPEPTPQRALPENVTTDALDLIVKEDVDWANIAGSGKDGKILLRDVRAYLGNA